MQKRRQGSGELHYTNCVPYNAVQSHCIILSHVWVAIWQSWKRCRSIWRFFSGSVATQVFQEHFMWNLLLSSEAWLCVHSSPELPFLVKVDLACKTRSRQIMRRLQFGTRTEIAWYLQWLFYGYTIYHSNTTLDNEETKTWMFQLLVKDILEIHLWWDESSCANETNSS